MISTYLRRQRTINGLLAGLLVSAGLGLTGYGAYSILSDVRSEVPVDTFEDALADQCEAALRTAQLVAQKDKSSGVIQVRGHSLEDAQVKVTQTSLAIQQCLGYTMKDFCMGTGCEGSVISFKLYPLEGKYND